MSGHFYQAYWDIVGPQVVQEVTQFFDTGSLPADWNFKQIYLIPKKPNPSKMTDMLPISLCSVIYKVVSKVMCNRLKEFLPDIVSATQGAFVAGRLISDNILLAHEMLHALRTNPQCDEDFAAIKIDMSKAYDRVEWRFLEELLIRLGFDIKWVKWVMVCVSSVSYSVLLNGSSYGYFRPERGLRQGDPLSPFLFILCVEALVHIMNKAELEGRLTGMKLNSSCPSIQHLLFADDNLFLCQANLPECFEFLKCLRLYGAASGQEINFQKSAITFGKKLDPYMKHLLGLYTGIELEGGNGKYLGLPECFSGSKKDLLQFITDRLKSRLSGWYEKTLSLGGKEVLLNSIALALPVYAMSCSGLANISVDNSQVQCVNSGGMQMQTNIRCIGRHGTKSVNRNREVAWRLLDEPNSLLARVYRARYFSDKSFMDAKLGYRPSYAWRSIMFGRELLERGLMKSIGDGQTTNVWLDKWVSYGSPRRPFNKEITIDLCLKLSSLITEERTWNIQRLHDLFPPCDVTLIRSYPPALTLPDRYIWAYTRDGRFTVKSGNWLLTKEANNLSLVAEPAALFNKLKERIWKVHTEPKIQMFLWRMLSGALAVADCMNSHGVHVNPVCQVCNAANETIAHVLFGCSLASRVWEATALPLPSQGFLNSITENVEYIFGLMNKSTILERWRNVIPLLLWEIWKARNVFVFENRNQDHHVLIASALETSEEWLKQQALILTESRFENHGRGSWTLGLVVELGFYGTIMGMLCIMREMPSFPAKTESRRSSVVYYGVYKA
ncbi:PREDICTED: uncharacterized protein LOC104743634 [Camelina sativa]|uniref:Uncharacterized protein LOC104743634 n=1 Tax=Camelina sativa TaxID=90675 RepID=A0ABM0VYB4_CAMSA|nr:PREDICTED: uncharacterized protein LOC104743634 [Camelina sativa]